MVPLINRRARINRIGGSAYGADEVDAQVGDHVTGGAGADARRTDGLGGTWG
jgi:hypothetical protein